MAEEKAASGGATILAEESAAVPAKRRKTITKVSESAEAPRSAGRYFGGWIQALGVRTKRGAPMTMRVICETPV